MGKANEVSEAIRKGTEKAKKDMRSVKHLRRNDPARDNRAFRGGRVLLKPASEGTGLIAGGAVRAILEVAGIKNILTKCLGSHNPHNLVKATLDGLGKLKNQQTIAGQGKRSTEI